MGRCQIEHKFVVAKREVLWGGVCCELWVEHEVFCAKGKNDGEDQYEED